MNRYFLPSFFFFLFHLESDVEQGSERTHRLVDSFAVALSADLFAMSSLGVQEKLSSGSLFFDLFQNKDEPQRQQQFPHLDSLVLGVESQLLEQTTRQQQTSAVGGGVVGESDRQAVASVGQLARVSSAQHAISLSKSNT
jgi:hypothetical protein